MRGLYPAFVGICAYCLIAAVIQVVWRGYHVPRPVMPPRKHVTALDWVWVPPANLDSAYHALPERRRETERKMKERLDHNLESWDSVETLKTLK